MRAFFQGLRRHGITLFVTFHIVCVILAALPRPPATDKELLEDPEIKGELDKSLGWLSDDLRRNLTQLVIDYTNTVSRVNGWLRLYLEPAGSTQGWNMFGGTPPRYPLLFVIEVRPQGETEYVLFQDLDWGTDDAAAMNFRHRKAHEQLAWGWGAPAWDAYAAYWARRWDEVHPDRPAEAVQLSVTRLTTPRPEDVRAGNADRKPEPHAPGFRVHVWERK